MQKPSRAHGSTVQAQVCKAKERCQIRRVQRSDSTEVSSGGVAMILHAGRGRHRQHRDRRYRGHQCNLHRSHDLRGFAQCRYGRLALAARSYGSRSLSMLGGPYVGWLPRTMPAASLNHRSGESPETRRAPCPSTGANSTVRSNPDAISLRNCIFRLYTPRQPRMCDFYHSRGIA